MDGNYEVSMTVRGVKDENVAWMARAMAILSDMFALDGTDINVDISVERNHDGVERVHDYVGVSEDGRWITKR